MIYMLKMSWFENETDLQKLTGLDHIGLWQAGFDLDDWDFGIRVNRPIHDKKTSNDCGELSVNWNLEGYWLLNRMLEYCVGPTYTQYGNWHYYLVHHS